MIGLGVGPRNYCYLSFYILIQVVHKLLVKKFES